MSRPQGATRQPAEAVLSPRVHMNSCKTKPPTFENDVLYRNVRSSIDEALSKFLVLKGTLRKCDMGKGQNSGLLMEDFVSAKYHGKETLSVDFGSNGFDSGMSRRLTLVTDGAWLADSLLGAFAWVAFDRNGFRVHSQAMQMRAQTVAMAEGWNIMGVLFYRGVPLPGSEEPALHAVHCTKQRPPRQCHLGQINLTRSSTKPHTKLGDPCWDAIRRARSAGPSLVGLRVIRQLGSGDIGSLYLVELKCTEGCMFAEKVMDKKELEGRDKERRAKTERGILELLDHPFLPTLYATLDSPKWCCLLTKFCPGGDLHVLRERQLEKRFDEAVVRYGLSLLIALNFRINLC
ncbi:hypothetical protein Vadar_028751 [Vaccinium darrowii]|nr:hypothetical protein Vadar_028751 [Vaccinium darrowii]